MFLRYKFNNQQETEFYRYTPPVPSYNAPYASNTPYYQKYKQETTDYNNNYNGRRAKNYNSERKNSQRKFQNSKLSNIIGHNKAFFYLFKGDLSFIH